MTVVDQESKQRIAGTASIQFTHDESHDQQAKLGSPLRPALRRRSLMVAVVGVAIVLLGLFAFRLRAANEARREAAAFQAQILSVTPARKLEIMNADALIIGKAQQQFITGTSRLWYTSRAKFTYSVDMRAIRKDSFAYDKTSDTLTIKIPKVQVQAALYGPRERIASLAPFRTEGGTGNELERVADVDLHRNAGLEASRPELKAAALKSASLEISALYEDAFKASGRNTRVVIVSDAGVIPPLESQKVQTRGW